MKKMNKLVALLLAVVMVVGLMPSMTVHAHAHDHAAQLQGVEEYPVLPLNTLTRVDIDSNGKIVYFAFTPEATDLYHFYSSSIEGGYADTYGSIYDAEMNLVAYNDDASYPYAIEGITGPNFCVSQVLEAGVTYILEARLYSSYTTGQFDVAIIQGHEYTSAVTKEATCTEDGVLTYTCAHCGASYEEVIPAAHTYGEDGNCVHCGEAYLITGTCGDDLTWSLDWFGKLTISGTGDMYHYVNTYSDKYPAPWYDDFSYDIKAVVVEEGVTSIGNYAFYQCAELATVELADSVASFGSNSFASCYSLESIKLPTALTEIPERCFSSCGALDEVIWNENLTVIGSNAFYGCALGDTVLPEGITTIGQYAFGGCGSMTKLTLPSTLTELDSYALSSMWNTRDFVFTGNAPVIGDNAFNYVTATVWYPLGNTTYTEEVMQNYGGTLTWKGLCTGSHAFGEPVNVPATCETGSYMTMTCTACGYVTISPENDDALGHDYQTEHYDGGCGDYSYDIITCSRCDYYSTENWIWAEHSYEVTTVAATCTADGYDVYTCSVCGDNYQTNWTMALGHSVAQWGEATEATCTEPSVRTGTCERCQETASEELAPALGHEWDEENGVANDDGSITYSCIRCDATYRTEGTALFLGDNQFTITGESGRTTKTYTAQQTGTLTITLNGMVYHNARAWDNGWTTEYWQILGSKWVFDQGYFNVYINDVNTSYTANGDHELCFGTVEVQAGDVVEVEVNHLEASDYYTNDVQFNLNLALEAAVEPADPTALAALCQEVGTEYARLAENVFPAELIAALDAALEAAQAGLENTAATQEELDALQDALLAAWEAVDAYAVNTMYTDVPEGQWYYDAVDFVTRYGYMNGMDAGAFNASTNVNRAQFVTILYRIAGEPAVTIDNPFVDVPAGQWYTNAVLWAYEKGITTGADASHFNPNGTLVRQNMVTFLMRFANTMGIDTSVQADLSGYTDADQILPYAQNAMAWAVAEGIISGMSESTLAPNGLANRAQIATIISRFVPKHLW